MIIFFIFNLEAVFKILYFLDDFTLLRHGNYFRGVDGEKERRQLLIFISVIFVVLVVVVGHISKPPICFH